MDSVRYYHNKINQNIIALPPLTIISSLVVSYQLYCIYGAYSNQKNDPWKYSKFRTETSNQQSNKEKKHSKSSKPKYSYKTSAAVAYAVPLTVCSIILSYCLFHLRKRQRFSSETFSRNSSILHYLTPNILSILHFSKRILECLFLHKFSTTKGGNISGSVFIGVNYAGICFQALYFQQLMDVKYYENKSRFLKLGVSLWIIGEIGNFYHHYLLAQLRNTDKKSLVNEVDGEEKDLIVKKYVVPHGCFFNYVWTPHYFFELIGWCGMGVVSNHLNMYLMAMIYTSYLFGRAVATKKWYIDKFGSDDDFPKDRKCIVPFIL